MSACESSKDGGKDSLSRFPTLDAGDRVPRTASNAVPRVPRTALDAVPRVPRTASNAVPRVPRTAARDEAQYHTSVLSQQQTSVLSQQQSSVLSQPVLARTGKLVDVR